jgi:hypothetical protein
MNVDRTRPEFMASPSGDPPDTGREVEASLRAVRLRMRRSYAGLTRARPLEPRAALRARAALAGAALIDEDVQRLWELDLAYDEWFVRAHDGRIANGLMYAVTHLQAGIYVNDLTTKTWCNGELQPRINVLVELNAAGLAVYGEILLLIRHGYPAGAEARWRTLHELGVTARLIARRGQKLASRYLDSRFMELRHLVRSGDLLAAGYRRSAEAKALVDELEQRAAEAEAAHGEELNRPNGWAFPIIGKRRITFADLEAAAGASGRRPAYAEASRRIHAGRLGSLMTLLVAGEGRLYVGQQFDRFLKPALRSIWSMEEIQHLLLREVHRTTKDEEPLVWSEFLTQLAAEADFEFRRAASMRASEQGDYAGAFAAMPSPAAAFAFAMRDAEKPRARTPNSKRRSTTDG